MMKKNWFWETFGILSDWCIKVYFDYFEAIKFCPIDVKEWFSSNCSKRSHSGRLMKTIDIVKHIVTMYFSPIGEKEFYFGPLRYF